MIAIKQSEIAGPRAQAEELSYQRGELSDKDLFLAANEESGQLLHIVACNFHFMSRVADSLPWDGMHTKSLTMRILPNKQSGNLFCCLLSSIDFLLVLLAEERIVVGELR